MPFPSSAITNRKVALVCARLIVQCVIGSFDSQIGIDQAVCFVAWDVSGTRSTAGHRDIRAPKYSTIREARQTLPHHPPA